MKVTIDVKPRESYTITLEVDEETYSNTMKATSYGATQTGGVAWEDTDLCEEIMDAMERVDSAAYDLMAHGDDCDI